MKFSVMIACFLGASSASYVCSDVNSSIECFSTYAAETNSASTSTHVCPLDYYQGLPSCTTVKASWSRRPCDATTSWAKCVK